MQSKIQLKSEPNQVTFNSDTKIEFDKDPAILEFKNFPYTSICLQVMIEFMREPKHSQELNGSSKSSRGKNKTALTLVLSDLLNDGSTCI